MKKMYVWVSMLLLGGALLVSCSDDEGGDDNKKITLSEETSKKQDFFADETSNNKGIQFTTQGPWQAKVEDVTGTKAAVEADWVVLSQYSGDAAGSYSLTVTLQPNYTGKERKAVIRIICGDTEITISISQKGNAENGFKPKMVKEILYEEIKGKEMAQYGEGDKDKMVYFYDERGRVVRIDWYDDGDANELELESKYEFDYDVVGEISIKNMRDLDSDYPETDLYVATLDKQGRVTELLPKKSSSSDEYGRFGYNEAGQLAKYEYKGYYGEEEIIKFDYTDGLLNKITSWDKYDGEEVMEIPLAKLYPNKYSATMANLDFNGLDFFGDDGMGILYSMRLLGIGSKYLMEISTLADYDEPVEDVGHEQGYPTPGEVIHHEYNSTQYHEIDIMNKFELDADKCVTKITADEPYDVIKVEYDIVVTNELVDPDRPEIGYRGERRNNKKTKLRTEKNQYVYTITYQE